jgi:hypothetical protein
MKFGILSSNNFTSNLNELAKSKLASNRLRLDIAKDAAQKKNYEVLNLDFYLKKEYADIFLIGKIVPQSGSKKFIDDQGDRIDNWLRYINEYKNSAKKIILDYTDNLIEVSDIRSNFYKNILNHVDICVVPSSKMKENLKNYFPKEIVIIEEPLEIKISNYNVTNFDNISALWFGHLTNINYLLKILYKNININYLTIVTSKISSEDQIKIKSINSSLEINFIEWEPNFYENNNLKCNVCLIPSDINDVRKNGVSNNRLIAALALGLVPLVSSVHSYKEYSNYYLDIESINCYNKNNYINTYNNIIKNRDLILSEYSKEKIITKWFDIL